LFNDTSKTAKIILYRAVDVVEVKVKGQGKLNTHIISESVLMLFIIRNHQN